MKCFGTDGIRGKFNGEFVNESFFNRLGQAVSIYLSEIGGNKISIAGDTRYSSQILKEAFCSGLKDIEVYDMGCVPTPLLAFGTVDTGSDLGVMITASHNPYTDNGIKFFDKNAQKISDDTQDKLEKFLDSITNNRDGNVRLTKVNLNHKYESRMSDILPKNCLVGKKIVLDTANGATVGISERVLKGYGAEVIPIGNNPDGKNINDGIGSEHPEILSDIVKKEGAFLGFAHDGDGDRLVVCDENGKILSGEAILGLIALSSGEKSIVTTLQSNSGLDESLKNKGINVVRSGIGDRLVMQRMIENNCSIGGENSGHYIFLDVSPCGDGLAAALKFLKTILNLKVKVSEVEGIILLYPLIQEAIKVQRKIPIDETETLSLAILDCERILEGKGRVFIRYSGTENKIRLLVESPDSLKNAECMKILKKAVENDLQ